MPAASMNGSLFFFTFIDAFSRYCWVYFLKQNSGVFETFKVFKALTKNKLGKNIKSLISHNGGEYYKIYFQ